MEPSVESYFMVDYSNAEIAALEEQFPKSFVYILISIDYKECTAGASQRRMAFRLPSKRYFFFWLYEEHHLC